MAIDFDDIHKIEGMSANEIETAIRNGVKLNEAINSEAGKRQDEDSKLYDEINKEKTLLQGNIDAETQARLAADEALDGKITDESTAREIKDAELQESINKRVEFIQAYENELDELFVVGEGIYKVLGRERPEDGSITVDTTWRDYYIIARGQQTGNMVIKTVQIKVSFYGIYERVGVKDWSGIVGQPSSTRITWSEWTKYITQSEFDSEIETIKESIDSDMKSQFYGYKYYDGREVTDDSADFELVEGTQLVRCINLTKTGTITVPYKIGDTTVVGIADNAFENSACYEVIIPNTITSIGASAFKNATNLMEINIPDSVTSIGESCFEGCSSLNTVYWSDNTAIITANTFKDCVALSTLYIGEIVNSIDETAFSGCATDSLCFYTVDGCTADTFAQQHNFETRYIITSVSYEKMSQELNAEASAREIADERLKYYGDKDIVPSPESYFTVNETGEAITGLTEDGETQTDLVIPYKINGKLITRISYKFDESGVAVGTPFEGCTSLVNVIMPNSITNMVEFSFRNCTSLKSIQLSDSLKTIEDGTFYGCTSLDNVVIPNSVTSIGGNAFLNCTSLKSIIIPDSVKHIYYAVFQGCTSLKTITIPNGIPYIGESVFENCTGLTAIYIPNSVTSIDTTYAFKGCSNLTIYCEQGSYAETYAQNNNIPVVYTGVKAETLDNKQDKVEISEYPEDNSELIYDLSIMHNQELRTKSTLANGITFLIPNDVYPDDYVTSLSFGAGGTAPQIGYTATGIINWVGTDCTIVDGKSIFAPKINTHYDIVVYFNGFQFVGLVNGFIPATIANSGIVEEATEATP